MTKAKRMMQENVKLVDLIIELVDARAPLSSRNPDIDELGKNKSRIVLLNKSDLADPFWNKKWAEYFEKNGAHVLEINSKTGAGVKNIQSLVKEACREKIERDRKRGIVNRPVRAMVVGIPNVGKSTFINAFAGKACTKTGNKPGVTKGKQWIRIQKDLELLDTPGILWPKFEDQSVGLKLALIGSINDEIIIMDEMACSLIAMLKELYPEAISGRYDIDARGTETEVLSAVAESRKCYLKGEQLDTDKAAGILLDDFRSGKLGRITLERPLEGNIDL
jgi:ribosome biogenesis GTPase A